MRRTEPIKLKLTGNSVLPGWRFEPVGEQYIGWDEEDRRPIALVTADQRMNNVQVQVPCRGRCGLRPIGGALDHSDHTRTLARGHGLLDEDETAIREAMSAAWLAWYDERDRVAQ